MDFLKAIENTLPGKLSSTEKTQIWELAIMYAEQFKK